MESCNSRNGSLRVVHGNANPKLAEDVCRYLNIPVTASRVGSFANGETIVKILESIRGDDIFVIQPTCSNSAGTNVNQAVMELLLIIHTLKLSSARRVIAVIPHYGYARQDRKHTGRVPISASAVARMVTEMGVNGVVTMDLHCGQIQGFFHGCPVADLSPSSEFAEYVKQKNFTPNNLVVVAPDAGAVNRARRMCDRIGASRIVTILKRRVVANQVDSMQLVGEVDECVCIIVDDMIDTAGTLCKAAEVLKEYGAKEVHAYATHGIFTDPACERLTQCDALVEVVVTDSIPQEESCQKCKKIKVISIAKLLADAIYRMHSEESLETVGQPEHFMPKHEDDLQVLESLVEEDEWSRCNE
ncbi:putative phosphoribosylpyrophosphate synthetase [Leishmania major strain Friedlin]|uniref:ribose-phosphate diphosphokinase n=1 Tax=Leishmania major TaxID=5664 RepID=Q4Q0M2_LEIMA|nr:putative phosphoribosylpyrophosphate synthetase [Leishmania major strain Friedlin]CAG9584092.1 phosphoribosylpyrophosphate_synthetase_-_putative [Leishmania major strain Friedlin]CAJ09512.1 putative phosphoribosylpyrophosphate synthetase [Leishmania major strain Friedlin]|eukprot:XP_001687126.1 putative phosphoribosylpyrophosphate synthetase [Leishmania major strain Friedlin]